MEDRVFTDRSVPEYDGGQARRWKMARIERTQLTCLLAAILAAGCGRRSTSGEPDGDAEVEVIEDGSEEVEEDPEADPTEDPARDADAEWVNPGCEADPNVVEDDLRLELVVDLTEHEEGRYPTWERATVTAPEAGEAVSFFGEGFEMGWASAGYDYDGHLATFCTGPFGAGEDVVVEAEFVSVESDIPMGLHAWQAGGSTVVGPSTEPYFAPLWILVPQSLHSVDDVHDDSPAVNSVEITVLTPDESWVVVGPGGPGVHEGLSWSFSLDVPQPIYAVSFAASPDYQIFSVGTSASGVEVIGAVTASKRTDAEACFPAAITAIDWMEATVGPWDWGGVLTLAEIPNYGGGMEHSTVIYLGSDTIEAGFSGDVIVVHETVHHWWGDNVRFSDWPHFWLAEGFDEWHTNFNIMGELLSEEDFDTLKLYYRTEAAEQTYPARDWFPMPGPLRFDDGDDCIAQWLTNMSLFYIYGAAFLEMVHQRLVRDFATDLNTVLAAWFAHKRLEEATTEEFLAFLEDTTGDTAYWEPLFDDWVYVTPAPTLRVSDFSYSGGVANVTVNRVDGAGQGLENLDVIFVQGTDRYPTTVDLPSGTDADTASVAMPASPERIVFDPDVFYVFRLATGGGWSGPEVGFSFD
jgi:hypothetical protein